MLSLGICGWLVSGMAAPSAEAEIVRRNLGKDAKGRTVSGYVFQPGRSFRKRPRSSASVFGGRRASRRRGIDSGYRGYGYPYYATAFYYYIPAYYCYPIRPAVYGGSRLSVHLRF